MVLGDLKDNDNVHVIRGLSYYQCEVNTIRTGRRLLLELTVESEELEIYVPESRRSDSVITAVVGGIGYRIFCEKRDALQFLHDDLGERIIGVKQNRTSLYKQLDIAKRDLNILNSIKEKVDKELLRELR